MTDHSDILFAAQCGLGEVSEASVSRPIIENASRKLEILVVEDNPMMRSLISRLLSRRGYSADMAVNGKEAVAAVQHKLYDLVLMDMQMPDMSGIAATLTIRGLAGPERLVPIVALTGNVLGGQRESCLAAGMNDYLPKPFDSIDFYAMIARWHAATAGSEMPPATAT